MRKTYTFQQIIFLFIGMTSLLFGDSSEKKRITFIVNPISHEIKNLNIQNVIENNLDTHRFEYKIAYTQYPQHATQLAYEALLDSADIVAAVGGDGTVNEVGRALVDSQATLAIIPVGSGNGLARHLEIPVGLIKAIKSINNATAVLVDTAKINDKTFLGVSGIGFDAHIAHQFAQFGKRGFFSYCQVVLKEFSRYKSDTYRITIDGKEIVKKAFILSFANSSQYGNDFIIAPKADMADGYLDLVIIDQIPIYSIPSLIYRFKHGSLDGSHNFETYRFKELTINHSHIQGHIDGEPLHFENEIKVTIQPQSLRVLVPI